MQYIFKMAAETRLIKKQKQKELKFFLYFLQEIS